MCENKVGANNLVSSLRMFLRPLQRVFAGLVFNGYVMGIERCRVTSKERGWREREWVKEREVSFLPSCFIYEGCCCSRGSDSWMEGRGEKSRREEWTPWATPETTSELIAHTPLPFTTQPIQVWGFAHLMMLLAFGEEFLSFAVKVAFRIKYLAYKCSYQLIKARKKMKSPKFVKTMFQEYILKQQNSLTTIV